jgi:FO synthase
MGPNIANETTPETGLDGWIETIQSPQEPLTMLSDGLKRGITRVLEGKALSREEAYLLINVSPGELPALCKAAAILRDRGKGRTISFSPKVFIPLTRLCRDVCGYCTFRQSPAEAERLYMSLEEVLAVARAGEALGCVEALFTLGERPEQRYTEAKAWLHRHGYRTTLEYLQVACEVVLRETSLLPHSNPGTMSRREMERLQGVNPSMGLMLENVSQRLCEPGGPHQFAPSKWPALRVKTLEVAGELKVPFTTGILIGLGETLEERLESILAIREIHRRHGHLQEVIIQNFRAKPHTPMGRHPDPVAEDLLWTVAAARLILGPDVNLQVPPNLSAKDYPIFLQAGINDWGGISPLTIDYVNPEAPWPQLAALRQRTEALGFALRPRLPVYPEYIVERDDYLPLSLKERIKSTADGAGYVKGGIERYAGTSGRNDENTLGTLA